MHLPQNYQFFAPVKINSGQRALEHLPAELAALNAGMPLIVADRKSRARTVANAFRGSGMTVAVCDALSRPPDLSVVQELAAMYRRKHCDALIAAGSGALIDGLKAVNLLVSLNREDLMGLGGENGVPLPLNPLVIAAVASGSGLEVSKYASLQGWACASAHLMPALAVIDPRLLRGTETEAVLDLSLSALAHAVESFGGLHKNPMADAYAYGAIRLISQNLVSVAEGRAPKTGVAALVNGAVMAGCALSNTHPGMVHLMGEAAVGRWNLTAGKLLGILLPYVMEYLELKGQYHTADLLLPLSGGDIYASTAEDLRGSIAINVVHAMLYDLNKTTRGAHPLTLKEAGVEESSLADVAELAAGANPAICDPKGARLILEHAWSGYPIVSL
jgi:alcohol dehydrogenase